jgi:hypothetical protein
MENGKTFKTKTGFCHILPEKIVLTRDGIIGDISKIVVGNGMSKTLIINSGFSIFTLYNAFTSFQDNQYGSTLLFSVLAIFLIYSIIKSLNNSATPIIERNKIKDAKFINGKSGLTRARFEIMFQDENGKLKKRLIMLPGSLSDGQNETEKAVEIMRNERILTS